MVARAIFDNTTHIAHKRIGGSSNKNHDGELSAGLLQAVRRMVGLPLIRACGRRFRFLQIRASRDLLWKMQVRSGIEAG